MRDSNRARQAAHPLFDSAPHDPVAALVSAVAKLPAPVLGSSAIRVAAWMAACLAASLSGCATYEPRPLTPANTIERVLQRSLQDPSLQERLFQRLPPAEQPAAAGWTLKSLALAAERYNDALAQARARLAGAEAALVTARQIANPSLQLPLGYTGNAGAGVSPYLFGLGLDLPLESPTLRAARVGAAERRVDAARLELEATAWQVRSHLRTTLLDLRHARRMAALARAQLALREAVAAMVERRVAVGEASAVELAQVRADVAPLRSEGARQDLAARQALAAVAAAVGVPPSQLEAADVRPGSLDRPPPVLADGEARDAALAGRCDVRRALADYEASQAALQAAVADQFPGVHLGPGYTYDSGAHKYSLAVTGIELPLFNRHEGPIAEARAQRRGAAAQFEAVVAQGLAQLDRARADFDGARQTLALAEQQREVQRQLEAAAARALRIGAGSRLDLVLAQAQAGAADLAREDAFDRLQRAAGALEDAMQSPFAEEDPR